MRKTILLADDSPTIQRLVTQTFADEDYEIVSVSNGEAAIRKFEELRPALVLADIYMPGKNGYEVCAHVKNHPELKATPVVLLIGAFDAFDGESAGRAGANGSITKPFEPHALVEMVQSMLPETEGDAETKTEEVHEAVDLLGLEPIFQEEVKPEKVEPAAAETITDEEVDRIADRVIQKLSVQVIENVAWDIVPDIAEKIVREMKKNNES